MNLFDNFSPMTSLEMNGHARFVFDWSDGRVMSERAYKMVKEDEAMAIREVSSVHIINHDRVRRGYVKFPSERLHETLLETGFT